MKFKLLFLMIFGFLFGDRIVAMSESLLQNQVDPEIMLTAAQSCLSDLQAENQRPVSLKIHTARSNAKFEYEKILNREDLKPYGKEQELKKVTSQLNENVAGILMASENARALQIIEKDDFYCYKVPCCACFIPLACYIVICTEHQVDTTRYHRAQFNAIKAAAIVEQNIQQDMKR